MAAREANVAETGSLFDAAELPVALKPPAYFKLLPTKLDTEFCCPRCAYEWGGRPKPNADPDALAAELEADSEAAK